MIYDLSNMKEMAMRAGDENSKEKHHQVEKHQKLLLQIALPLWASMSSFVKLESWTK